MGENIKKTGAASIAKKQLKLCLMKDNAVKSECTKESKSRFRAAGGRLSRETASANDDMTDFYDEEFNTDYAKAVGIEEVRKEASDTFLICMKEALTSEQVSKGVTVGEFKTAASKCKPIAKNVFEDAGGDVNTFDTEFIKQVRASKSEALSVCRRSASNDVTRAACDWKIDKMASLLGEKNERKIRNKQDGASVEAASVAEACQRDQGTNCKEKAKNAFEKCGGAKTAFETELRRGCGTLAATTKRACMRNDDGSTKTGANADHCLAEAKDAYESARADGKKYHKEVAMASKSDWNDDDFDALSKVEDKPMQLEKGSEVDVKVSMTGMTTAKMQESKPNIAKAVK